MNRLTEWIDEEKTEVSIVHYKMRDAMIRLAKYEDTGLTPEEIMAGKMLTGWIPVEERLPEEPEEGLVDMDSLEEYIVTISGATKPTVLFYAGDGEWYREGIFYSVDAWMPFPETFRSEN